jgi:hypothetical protein
VSGPNLIGQLFPAGEPVPPELVIGRQTEITSLELRLREGIGTLVSGERRIGKTTVCDAACARIEAAGRTLIVKVEVPERRAGSVSDLLHGVVAACERVTRPSDQRKVLRAARPALEELLREAGLPLDLRELGADPGPESARQIVALPLAVARKLGRRTIFYLDELQRVAEYADGGDVFVSDLVDFYTAAGASEHVTVLVDGSDERTLELLERDLRLGKLVKRLPIGPTISESEWRTGLVDHYRRADLRIDADALDSLVAFGAGRPYPTMLAAQLSGLNARELKTEVVAAGDVAYAVREARKQLDDERL